MAIARVAKQASVASTAGTAVTGTMPAGVQAGHVIIVSIDNNSTATIATPPAGYTQIRQITDGTLITYVYRKVAGASEGDVTATLSVSAKWVVQIAVYSGVDTTSPILAENGVAEGATAVAAHATPAVVNTDAGAWAVASYCTRGLTSGTWTSDAALVEQLDNTTSSTNQIASCFDDSNGAVTAASHAYTATASGTSALATMWLGYLRPAAAGAGSFPPMNPLLQRQRQLLAGGI